MSSISFAGWAADLDAGAGFESNLTIGAAAVGGAEDAAGAAAAAAGAAARVGAVRVAVRALTGEGFATLVRAVRFTDRFATVVVVAVAASDAGAATLLSVAGAGWSGAGAVLGAGSVVTG
jgi:hypothetical protein